MGLLMPAADRVYSAYVTTTANKQIIAAIEAKNSSCCFGEQIIYGSYQTQKQHWDFPTFAAEKC